MHTLRYSSTKYNKMIDHPNDEKQALSTNFLSNKGQSSWAINR